MAEGIGSFGGEFERLLEGKVVTRFEKVGEDSIKIEGKKL
jgi:hypothetical protein